jgi:hypothetical protein
VVIAWDLGSGNQQRNDQDSELHRTFLSKLTQHTAVHARRQVTNVRTSLEVTLNCFDASEFLNDSLYARNAELEIAVPEQFGSECFQSGSPAPGIER